MGNSSVQCKCEHSSSSNWDEKRGHITIILVLTKNSGQPRTGIVHSTNCRSYGNIYGINLEWHEN
jgi:hypothetical protein